MIDLCPDKYAKQIIGIDARSNAALRDGDCASKSVDAQQEADVNHLFWVVLILLHTWTGHCHDVSQHKYLVMSPSMMGAHDDPMRCTFL
jgi:hypothetical protein